MSINSTIAKVLGFALIGGIVLSILALVLIPFGLSLNLAYFKLTGSFLGLENFLASWTESISFWFLVIVFIASILLSALVTLAKPLRGIIALLLASIYILATFGAIELVEILIESSDLERIILFEDIIKSIVYSLGIYSIFTALDSISQDS